MLFHVFKRDYPFGKFTNDLSVNFKEKVTIKFMFISNSLRKTNMILKNK